MLHSKIWFLLHFKLVNTKYSNLLCYHFSFNNDFGVSVWVRQQLKNCCRNFVENISEKPVMSQRKHSWILLVQAWLGWACNFRKQTPHLELSTVWLLIGCVYFYFNTTTLSKVVAASTHHCLVERTSLEWEISCRYDSEMEKCIAGMKENHKDKQPGEKDTGRPQRLQSPSFLLLPLLV